MGAFASIGVNNDFSSGQTSISMWTTDYKFSGWIYKDFNIILEQCFDFSILFFYNPWNQNIDDVFAYDVQHGFICLVNFLSRIIFRLNKIVMLGRNHDGINSNGFVVIVIFDGYLGFGIR